MNNENTIKIKKVLEEACGGTGGGDRGWQAEGVERLFLDECGIEGFRAGCIEVRHGEGIRNSESVRVELELAPALAARVIALVTNTTLGEMPDLSEPEQVAIDECVSNIYKGVEDETLIQKADKALAGLTMAGGTLNPFSAQDRRNKEIADQILAQRKERELEKEHAAENKPSDEIPEELNFDLPDEIDP